MRNAFADVVLKAAESDKRILVISGDAGLGVFDNFKKACPDQFLNLGVAEQNMMGFAAGCAMAGRKVFTYNIVPFVLYRCFEQVRNDVCYQRLPVTLVGIGAGLTYAPQGMTHYSIDDLAIARALPNLRVFSPMDPVEAQAAANYALQNNTETIYVRLTKKGDPVLHQQRLLDITQPQVIHHGKDVAVLFHGSISVEIMKMIEILKSEGILPMVASLPQVQPLDLDAVVRLIGGIKTVYCVEEHYVDSGLAAALGVQLLEKRLKWDYHSIGLQSKFIHEIHGPEGMRRQLGLSGAAIAANILGALRKGNRAR